MHLRIHDSLTILLDFSLLPLSFSVLCVRMCMCLCLCMYILYITFCVYIYKLITLILNWFQWNALRNIAFRKDLFIYSFTCLFGWFFFVFVYYFSLIKYTKAHKNGGWWTLFSWLSFYSLFLGCFTFSLLFFLSNILATEMGMWIYLANLSLCSAMDFDLIEFNCSGFFVCIFFFKKKTLVYNFTLLPVYYIFNRNHNQLDIANFATQMT